jgi:hypothetical protein
MAKKKCQKCPPPAPSWLATFADLSTLLLTFFVLLISMATFNPVKFAQVLGYFQTPTGMGYNIPTPIDPKSAEEFFVQIVRASTIRQDTPEGGHQPTLAGEHVKVTDSLLLHPGCWLHLSSKCRLTELPYGSCLHHHTRYRQLHAYVWLPRHICHSLWSIHI